jgi:hypothetical protein
LIVIAYRKFSDTLQNELRASTPPKPAKAPKVASIEPPQARTLGGLDALGGVAGETENAPAPADTAPATWGEADIERAAIIEHDGKIPRAWAEGFAQLRPERPPFDVPPKRWQQFIDDIGCFLDAGWAEKAAALSWGPLDLFGCDRERPFDRIGHAGLLWLLDGDRCVELNRQTAVIERRTGTRQTFRRRPVAFGEIVLAWELVPERPKPAATV